MRICELHVSALSPRLAQTGFGPTLYDWNVEWKRNKRFSYDSVILRTRIVVSVLLLRNYLLLCSQNDRGFDHVGGDHNSHACRIGKIAVCLTKAIFYCCTSKYVTIKFFSSSSYDINPINHLTITPTQIDQSRLWTESEIKLWISGSSLIQLLAFWLYCGNWPSRPLVLSNTINVFQSPSRFFQRSPEDLSTTCDCSCLS